METKKEEEVKTDPNDCIWDLISQHNPDLWLSKDKLAALQIEESEIVIEGSFLEKPKTFMASKKTFKLTKEYLLQYKGKKIKRAMPLDLIKLFWEVGKNKKFYGFRFVKLAKTHTMFTQNQILY